MSSGDTNNKGTTQDQGQQDTSDMKVTINPQRAQTLTSNIQAIHTRIQSVTKSHSITKPVRLVAVSKLKPASDILALHSSPPTGTSQLHFGENYVQELLEKSSLLPSSIRWHFIGGLQSNKCVQLARQVPSLWAVESVDSIKKAKFLEKGRAELFTSDSDQNQDQDSDEQQKEKDAAKDKESEKANEPLRIFVQVNTSGEESKSGIDPKSPALLELATLIHSDTETPHLKLQGLMTIGAIARSKSTTEETENEDFITLRDSRDWVAEQLSIPAEELELSMGMSEDFEGAIVQGSDEVRVGSTIFGERPPKKEAKVLEDVEGESK